jgi:hypothetical protein
MIDFVEDPIGLHVNGQAHILDNDSFSARYPGKRTGSRRRGDPPSDAVVVEVTEAYIHCRGTSRGCATAQTRLGHRRLARKGGHFAARAAPSPLPTHPHAPASAGRSSRRPRAVFAARSHNPRTDHPSHGRP